MILSFVFSHIFKMWNFEFCFVTARLDAIFLLILHCMVRIIDVVGKIPR